MSEIIEGPERSELGKQYDKYQEAIRIGFAQGRQSMQAEVEALKTEKEDLLKEISGIYWNDGNCQAFHGTQAFQILKRFGRKP